MTPALFAIIPAVLDKLFPDKQASDAAKLRLLELQQNGELAALTAETELAKGQIGVNAIEAASTRLFVAGWRPFVGWICGFAIGFKFIGGPLMFVVAQFFGTTVVLPEIAVEELLTILLGMLGLGAMRTHEKVKGVA